MGSGGQAANAFGKNFMDAYLGVQANDRANEESAQNKLIREAQLAQLLQAEQEKQDVLAGQRNLRGQVNMQGLVQSGIVDPRTQSSDPVALKQVAMGKVPQNYPQGMLSDPTMEQRVNQYMSDAPIAGLQLGVEMAKAKGKPREVNVANEIDTILGGLFPGYYTDENVRQKALGYYGTPEGSKIVQGMAIKYNQSKAPPIYNFLQTDQGIIPGNIRTGGTGKSTGLGGRTPASQIQTGVYLDTMGEAIKRIESNYKPDYVGAVMGRVGETKGKFVDLPVNQTTFYADVNDIKDQLLRARSGAQINEQEYARLVKFLPDANSPAGNFEAKLARFKQELNDMRTSREKELSTGGYKQSSPKTDFRTKYNY
jgi:hypothetical protein